MPKLWRVRDHKTIKRLKLSSRKTSCGLIKLSYVAGESLYPELMFSINKKFGSAVQRNKARRVLKEAFMHAYHIPEINQRSGSYMISARPGVNNKTFPDLVTCVKTCLENI